MNETVLSDIIAEARRLSDNLEKGLAALRQSAQDYAEAEQTYREARARAYLRASGTVSEREAYADLQSLESRRLRDLADGMRSAALEAVRSRRQQLSALQSILAANRAEAEYVRTGPS